jgi:hypothetical protein
VKTDTLIQRDRGIGASALLLTSIRPSVEGVFSELRVYGDTPPQ